MEREKQIWLKYSILQNFVSLPEMLIFFPAYSYYQITKTDEQTNEQIISCSRIVPEMVLVTQSKKVIICYET